MKKKIFAVAAVLVIGAAALTGCGQSGGNGADSDEDKLAKEYIVDSSFDADRKSTIYGDMRYYGFYDFLDFLDTIESDDVEPKIDYEHNVNPDYLVSGYDGGDYYEINTELLNENYNHNFQQALRKSDDYMISDYQDGVCINRFVFNKAKYKGKKTIKLEIPETIEGKKVLKLSGFIIKDKDGDYQQAGFLYDVPGKYKISLKIPETVTDISYCALNPYQYEDEPERGVISEISVSKKNESFSSADGVLYSKDKDWLFNIPSGYEGEFTVPDSVKYIAESFGDYEGTITIGKNVEKIYQNYVSADKVRVYKGSYADKWLKENEVDKDQISYI